MQHDHLFRQGVLIVVTLLSPILLWPQVSIKDRVEIHPTSVIRNQQSQAAGLDDCFEPLVDPDQRVAVTHRACIITATCVLPHYNSEFNVPTDLVALTLRCFGAAEGEYWLGTSNATGVTSQQVTFKMDACGSASVYAYVGQMGDLSGCIVTAGGKTATFLLTGTWRGTTITASVLLSAQPDPDFNLAAIGIQASQAVVTQCSDKVRLDVSAWNTLGGAYSGPSCHPSDAEPLTVSVQSHADVTLECTAGGKSLQGKEVTFGVGTATPYLRWNYQTGGEGDTAVVTAYCLGKQAQTVVRFTVDPTQPQLVGQVDGEGHYGMKQTLYAWFHDACGRTTPLPASTTFKFEITGPTEYGDLFDPASGKSGVTLDSVMQTDGAAVVEYRAYGIQPPFYGVDIPVRVSLSDQSVPPIELVACVISDDIRVTAVPSSIAYGETSQIMIERKNRSGTYSPIPSDWPTAFQLVNGDGTGLLYCPDSSQAGSRVAGVYQSANYYAKPRGAELDSEIIPLYVVTVNPNVIPYKANEGKKPVIALDSAKPIAQHKTSSRRVDIKASEIIDPPPDLGPGIGYYGYGKIVVKKKQSLATHLDVWLEQNTVAFTESARIFVQAKDKDDREINLDGTVPLKLSIITNGAYGSFISPDGDTARGIAPRLDNVQYLTASRGMTKFVALWRNPDAPLVVRILASLENNADIDGSADVTVLDQRLKILIIGKREVWPLMPEFSPEKPNEDNTTFLEALWTRGGKPVAAESLLISSDYVDGSGGHDHVSPRRSRTNQNVVFENYGHFVSTDNGLRMNPLALTTMASGKSTFVFVSSRFGDRMNVRVESARSTLVWDSTSIVERVPDLELLPARSYYDKIGGTDKHHGPRDDLYYAGCREPDNDHWGRTFVNNAISKIAKTYHDMFPDDSILHINDISLPFGGRFDADGAWDGNEYHTYHRLGRDVDIKSKCIPAGDQFNPQDDKNDNGMWDAGERIRTDVNGNRIFERNREAFVLICREIGKVREVKLELDPEHYHLYFWDRKKTTA